MENPSNIPNLSQQSPLHYSRGNVLSDKCPSREVLKHVTSRWGTLVMVALLEGTFRFSDLRRRVQGVSEKMLAQTLQLLESDGFVIRTAYPVVPPHVEYQLTPMGQAAAIQVKSLVDWIEDHIGDILSAQAADIDLERRL